MDDMLERANKVFKNLKVFPQKMHENLELTRGRIMAEAIVTELTKRGMERQKAHEVLRKASMESLVKNKHLKNVLVKNKEVMKYLSEKELDKLMDYEKYTGLASKKVREILKKWR